MLATAVRIDRLAEADVGRLVAADDAARSLRTHFGAQARSSEFVAVVRLPAVVHGFADGDLETARQVRCGTSAFDRDTHDHRLAGRGLSD